MSALPQPSSGLDSQITPSLSFVETLATQFQSEPTVVLEIAGRIPSWNEILGMEHWARDKYKTSVRENFLCALRATAQGSSTKTTFAKNILLTAAATLDSYDKTVRERRRLRSAKRKSEKASLSSLKSKSSKPADKVPF